MRARASPISIHCAAPSIHTFLAFTMSVAGLRFSRSSYPSTPLETRSGSYIYDGAPSTYHEWEFRTSMRLKLYEDAIRSKSKKPKGDAKSIDPDDSDDDSRAEEANPTRAATAPVPSEDGPDMEATTVPADGSSSLQGPVLPHRSQMTRVQPRVLLLHCQWTNRRPTLLRRGRRWSMECWKDFATKPSSLREISASNLSPHPVV